MTEWYWARGKQRLGPFSPARLRQLAVSGRLQPADMVLRRGAQRWVPARSVEGLFADAGATGNGTPSPAPRRRRPWQAGAGVLVLLVLTGVVTALNVKRIAAALTVPAGAGSEPAAASGPPPQPVPEPGPTDEPDGEQPRPPGPAVVALVAGPPRSEAGAAAPVVAAPRGGGPSTADDLAPCFHFPKDWKVSPDGTRKALAYLRSLSADPGLTAARDVVCPPEARRLVAGLKATVGALRIDGKDADWKAIPPAVEDEEGNVQPYAKEKPTGETPAGMDLAEVSYLYTEGSLFLRFKTHGPPAKTGVSYWFCLHTPAGERLYDIAVGDGGPWLNVYEKGRFARAVRLAGGKAEVRVGDVVEARVACSEMPRLPETFDVIPNSLCRKTNHISHAPRFSAKAARLQAATTPAYLLARYADRLDLRAAGLLPLAVALAESFAFEHVEPPLREAVVADGVALLAAARELRGRLEGLPLEALIAWSNRGMNWGGLAGLLVDRRGRITREAYEFMFLNPAILPEVRAHLLSLQVGGEGSARDLAGAIDRWATSKNRYRWKLEVMKEWSETFGGPWVQLYKDAAEDVREGRDKVCTVNGKQVYYYAVGSPNVDWRLYRENGFYHGCCGDVAVMEMLACKALGIPDVCFFWRFGKEDALCHTFAGYYDREAGVWRSPQQPPADIKEKGASVLQWSLPPLGAGMPRPAATPVGGGAELWVSERSPYRTLSPAEMRRRLAEGFPHEEFCRLLYAQLGQGKRKGPQR